jgi:hypothetical protein
LYALYFLADVVFCVVYYLWGMIAALKKSYKLLDGFASFALFGLILEILLTYINKYLFLIIFKV